MECTKSHDASAKSFMQPEYSMSREGQERALIMKETLQKNDLNFVKDIPII